MKVYVDAWGYVTEKFVNMGNIELCEGILRYKKADYPPIPNFISIFPCPESLDFTGFPPFSGFGLHPFARIDGGPGPWVVDLAQLLYRIILENTSVAGLIPR